ncbi:MAG: hypothetical protein NVS9B14_10310 [Candidatus Acidiferrum sp.]
MEALRNNGSRGNKCGSNLAHSRERTASPTGSGQAEGGPYNGKTGWRRKAASTNSAVEECEPIKELA